MRDVVVVIPSYEPDTRIINVCNGLFELGIYDVVVVDDGSGENFCKTYKEIENKFGYKIIRHAVNLGKGRALKTGFNYVLNEYPEIIGIVTADSDGQHTPEDIKACAEKLIKNPNNLILGCRNFTGKEIPLKSKLGNEFTKRYVLFFVG